MKCPNCNDTLLMTERHQVEIDYCPSCRGVWLDKGELDKLLQYASSQNNAPSPTTNYQERPVVNRDYNEKRNYEEESDRYSESRDSREYQQKYPHKKKSFLSDFFDFD
ncbi:TFIIB-type zinc ribbon-containing protein [Sphingobacterium sp. SYP-B4668]|uniref:TFIIB-type zinc ribbon-containing protein n=1 Tax=Sphingobacterium sp. SYP-B4668 TaxID=2996035 RepID=UPI0022DDBA14|nr:zf-TFIIB domain-containing protein [Sphingobacterium sp. SYP-B4668]